MIAAQPFIFSLLNNNSSLLLSFAECFFGSEQVTRYLYERCASRG
jgi:hypothetical protein